MGLTSRQNMAIAASLAALVVVAPIAFKTYQDERTTPLPSQPAKPETVAVVPPKPANDQSIARKGDGATGADAQA